MSYGTGRLFAGLHAIPSGSSMLPVFVFLSLPTLSLALLLAILLRRMLAPVPPVRTGNKSTPIRRAMSRIEALHLLGLENESDPIVIRAAYKRLMIQYHPDHGGSHQAAAT